MEWLKLVTHRAIDRAFVLSELVAGVLALALGGVAYEWPRESEVVNILMWAVPLTVFIAVALVQFVYSAPASIYREIRAERDELRRDLAEKRVKREHLDELGRLLTAGNSGLFNNGGKRITSKEECAEWQKRFDEWHATVAERIEAYLSYHLASRFLNLIDVDLRPWELGFDDDHNFQLCILHKKLHLLGNLIDRHSEGLSYPEGKSDPRTGVMVAAIPSQTSPPLS